MKGKHSALRKGRFSEVGRIYHIVFRTKEVDLTEAERACVCSQFIRSSVLRGNELLAWVVMPDHVHLLFELNEAESLGCFVARVKSCSSRAVNQCRESSGSVWSRGYFDRALREEDDLVDVARYIVMNPLRAGLVRSVRDYSFWNAAWV